MKDPRYFLCKADAGDPDNRGCGMASVIDIDEDTTVCPFCEEKGTLVEITDEVTEGA
jgi:hypothetical protein